MIRPCGLRFSGMRVRIASLGHVRSAIADRLRRMTSIARRHAAVDELPPQTYFVVSAVFHYLGPSFAVLLFARVDVLGVAWLRIAAAAAIFAAWRRPWRAAARARPRRPAAAARVGRRARAHERLLLQRDRAAAARHRRGDRVPAGDRARGARARARCATRSRSASRSAACTCSPTCAWPASRSASRSRSPTRSSSRCTSSSPTAWRSGRRSAASTAWRRRCSSRSSS